MTEHLTEHEQKLHEQYLFQSSGEAREIGILLNTIASLRAENAALRTERAAVLALCEQDYEGHRSAWSLAVDVLAIYAKGTNP